MNFQIRCGQGLNSLRGELTQEWGATTSYTGGPKSKQLPNDQKIVLNRIKPVNEIIYLFVKLKYQSRTLILLASIRYPMHDLLYDLNTMTHIASLRYASDTINDVSALSDISSL